MPRVARFFPQPSLLAAFFFFFSFSLALFAFLLPSSNRLFGEHHVNLSDGSLAAGIVAEGRHSWWVHRRGSLRDESAKATTLSSRISRNKVSLRVASLVNHQFALYFLPTRYTRNIDSILAYLPWIIDPWIVIAYIRTFFLGKKKYFAIKEYNQ